MCAAPCRLIAVFCAAALFGPTVRAEESVTVTVTGEGVTRDDAIKNALRRALEQGGRQEIHSYSQVENFELIRDTIYARAAGIVGDFRILEEGPAMGGTYMVRIEAQVSKSALATTWGEVQNVLDQIGRPGIAVSITEWIDGTVTDSSILESKIEEKLIRSGFDVYDSRHLEAKAQREMDDAVTENDIAKMQALAKDFNTQIFIVGSAHANRIGLVEASGVVLAMYNCDAMAKMYYTDTGKLIASESIPQQRGGARGHESFSPQAARQALSFAGTDLVDRIYETCMEQWATRITAGDMIELEIAGLRLPDAIKIKRRLGELEGVSSVNYDLSKGIATYRIKAAMNAESLAERLVEPEWEAMFEIVDLKMNRIQAKAIQ